MSSQVTLLHRHRYACSGRCAGAPIGQRRPCSLSSPLPEYVARDAPLSSSLRPISFDGWASSVSPRPLGSPTVATIGDLWAIIAERLGQSPHPRSWRVGLMSQSMRAPHGVVSRDGNGNTPLPHRDNAPRD